MSKKIKIAIFTATNIRTSPGSNNTLLNVINNLNQQKYTISIVLVDNLIPKRLTISEKRLKLDPTYLSFKEIKHNKKISSIYFLNDLSLTKIKRMFDFAIITIYNEFGEDGKLIGLLDLIEIPYLSPGLKSSVVAFDKQFTKAILKYHELLVPKSIELNKSNKNRNLSSFYPVIVKPTSNGASRGTMLVKKQSELKKAIKKAFNFSNEVLIEEYIKGEEFTVGVVGHYTNPKTLPVIMIKPKNDFFDYEAKYVQGKAEELCPAPISKNEELKLQRIAVKVYKAIKAENHARIDMIKKGDKIYILEINTFPGLLSTSLFPKELEAAGISMKRFLDESIKNKLK